MPVPESFRTARLEAERIAPSHLPALRALHGDPEAMAELGGVRSVVETDRYLARNMSHWDTHGFGVWMLRHAGGADWIGRLVLRWLRTENVHDVEIGFALRPDQWGRGLATEAAGFALGVARGELELCTLIGVTTPTNEASQRVLYKIGLRHESDVVIEGTHCMLHRVRW
ncbi:MAG: GNAT family N-acetyltransferase [Myxococcota bacterium]|nr:GNAT family N-acetyltransferase [Myxococcota bacterium]